MTWQSFEVEQVLKGKPDAVIGVNMGGDFGYRTFDLHGDLGDVDPVVGDNVIIDVDSMPGGSNPVVVRYPVPDRNPTVDTITLTISNAAPASSLGFEAATAVYAKDGAIWVVRNTPAPPSTAGSLKVLAAASRTWDPSNGWRSDDTKPRQGSFGSGTNKGCWFYPAGAFAPLASHTGVTATLTITRDARGGTPWSPKQLVVWAHNHASQPVGEPALTQMTQPSGARAGINDTVTFALPAAIVSMLAAGTAQGVAIASGAESDYLICLCPNQDRGSGTLTFRWAS